MTSATFTNLSNTAETFTTASDSITLSGSGTTDLFNLLDSNDSLSVTGTGAYTNVTVLGGLGNDFVSGLGTGALIYGQQGDDQITFTAGGGGTVYGGQGQDVITASGGAGYLIYGNFGNDSISLSTSAFSGAGSSTVYGGNGTDFIVGSLGTDLLNGGQDNDTIITFSSNTNSTLIGGTGNDFIQSGGTNALIYGNVGSDVIFATGSGSTAFGGQGSDVVTVGSTTATAGQFTSFLVYGNIGDDSISLQNVNTSVAYGGQGTDTITVVGNSAGASAAATSASVGANNVVYGNLGDDVINLGTNQGTVYGGQGNDVIISDNAYSSVSGGLGNDTFIANGAVVANPTGTATTAGVGAGTGGPSAMTITDFVSGSDKVSLGGPVATSANFSSATVVGGLSQAIQAGQNSGTTYTFVAGSTDGYLFYNGGNGAPLVGVTLSGDNRANGLVQTDIISSNAAVGNNGAAAAAPTTPPPIATSDTFRGLFSEIDGNVQTGLAGNDVEGAPSFEEGNTPDQNPSRGMLTSQIVTGPTFGKVTLNADGSFQYMASDEDVVSDQFTYRDTSNGQSSNAATVTLFPNESLGIL